MATLTLTASTFCGGNGHFDLAVTGARTASFKFSAAEIRDLNPTKEQMQMAVAVILAIWAENKTPGQAKTQLLSGVTVTI